MKKEDSSRDVTYTKDVAISYESDRKNEEIWQLEQSFVEELIKDIPVTSYVLDLPVGTGRFFDFYHDRNLRVLGVDISEHMLTEARKKLKSNSIELVLGDVMKLNYPDNSFTHLVCFRLLHLIPSEKLEDVINELARVTGETLYFQAYIQQGSFPLIWLKGVFSNWFNKLRLSKKKPKLLPWSHIQSYNHNRSQLLKIFQHSSLRLERSESLGFYGSLNVVVFTLKKER
jgi:ubiquinone/menaquinone biosynthesis C-methylase UbiE